MTKYTRSIQKLTALIKDIFNYEDISIDTKAILLVLAATMSPVRFNKLLQPLDNIYVIKDKLIAINSLRIRYGHLFRDYIILHALQACKTDITSDELQQFIIAASSRPVDLAPLEITPALGTQDMVLKPEYLARTIDKALSYLIVNLDLDVNNYANVITDAYLHCRSEDQPEIAYYAIIYAMSEILSEGGIDADEALNYSYKLAKHALDDFMRQPNLNTMLHVYKGSAITSS